MTATLDDVDRHILNALQRNARTSNTEIARALEMAPSAILERIRKLEQRGVILGYEVRVAPKTLGLGLTAFCFVRESGAGGGKETSMAIAALPEVTEVHRVAGEDCLLVKLRVRDTDHLSDVFERMKAVPLIAQTRTTIVLSTEKETCCVAIPEAHS